MRRGQVALEFLMTYGWAMLVLLVMIGALSYFGVSNPQKLLPSKCLAGADFQCVDYLVDGSQEKIYLKLRQGLGKTIYVGDVACEYEGNMGEVAMNIDGIDVTPGEEWSPRETLEIVCSMEDVGLSKLAGLKARVRYSLPYKMSTAGFTHESYAELFTEVQG